MHKNITALTCHQYKIIRDMFFLFFHTTSLKSGMCFIFIAHLNLDQPQDKAPNSHMWLVVTILDTRFQRRSRI